MTGSPEARSPSGRVAFAVPRLAVGGAERTTVTLANALAATGLGVDLVVVTPGGPLRDQVGPDVRVVELRCRRVLTSLVPLAGYLRASRPDWMVASGSHLAIAVLLARRLTFSPARVVVAEHTLLSRALALAPSAPQRWIYRATRLFYPWADAVVVPSEAAAREVASVTRLPPASIRVMPNPVAVPGSASDAFGHPWLGTEEPPLLLFLGRLEPEKDPGLLLEAFAEARRDRPLRLLVVGDGSLRRTLEDRVLALGLDGSVAFTGIVTDAGRALAAAAALVLTSRYESFGNVIVEALSVGTPVVSVDCPGGPREILDGDRFGRVVPSRDPASVARAILETLDDPPDREALRSRAEDFRPEAVAARWLALLGEGQSGDGPGPAASASRP